MKKWIWLKVFNKNDTKGDPNMVALEAGTNLAMPWFLSAAVPVISIWFSKMEGFAEALPCFLRSFSYWREGISKWPYDMSCEELSVSYYSASAYLSKFLRLTWPLSAFCIPSKSKGSKGASLMELKGREVDGFLRRRSSLRNSALKRNRINKTFYIFCFYVDSKRCWSLWEISSKN